MGRPRLYNSSEERREAHRRSSQKFYNNNRGALCKKRHHLYRKQVKEKESVLALSKSELNSELSLEPTAFIEERRIHLINVTNNTIFGYVDDIVKACIRAPEDAIGLLTDAEHMWEESIYWIRDALAEILQDYGCGEEYRKANVTANKYQNLLTLLEDVHASAVVHTASQFEDGYHTGVFAYQQR